MKLLDASIYTKCIQEGRLSQSDLASATADN